MTPAEALANLDNATATLTVNRQTHAGLIESLNVLRKALDDKDATIADLTAKLAKTD